MENILLGFVILIGIIVISSIVNEKKLHLPQDIALLIFSSILGLIILLLKKIEALPDFVTVVTDIKLDTFLLECVLGFMIFASASKTHFDKFFKNIVPISCLAVFATIVSSIIYGLIFYVIATFLNLNLNIWVCLLLGTIISPTEPMAALSELSKNGLSKSVVSVLEGESLLSDGVCVALLVFFKGIISSGTRENLLFLIFKEITGALFVGFIISFVLFKLLKMSNNPILHIFISLFDVSLSYVICEICGFSGVIASVVCGMYFSYQMNKISRWKEVVDPKELYEDFWSVISTLLNSILFVLVGISIASFEYTNYLLILIPVVIVLNLLTRIAGVVIPMLFLKKIKIPGKYNLKESAIIFSWTALKGGISLAFMLSSKDVLTNKEYLMLLNATIVTILFTMVVQGLTASKVYEYVEKIRERRIEEMS